MYLKQRQKSTRRLLKEDEISLARALWVLHFA
jgi:hypothetical protein